MSKNKPTPGGRSKKNTAVSLVRSVAAGGNSEASVEMRYEDENVWLTQKMMAALYDVTVPAINQHLKRIFSDNELEESSVVKQYLIAAADGKNYQTKHYSLQAIIAVGFKIENERAVQFRKWANQIVKDYTIQGWTMDAERLKQGGILTDEFFERQLEKIREIRLSERKFYQKITDIYATALDYDPSATATKRFFAAVQNKMQAMRKIPMTMEEWEKRLSGFLQLWDRDILQDAGKVSAELAKAHAESEFEKYRIVQDRLFEAGTRLTRRRGGRGGTNHEGT